jgi:3-oxoacyl-[acyl-carrier protein] reductase
MQVLSKRHQFQIFKSLIFKFPPMLLQNKNAVIYGAAGSLGRTIAKAFVAEGAKLFLSGHHLAPVQKLAYEIVAAGGQAEAAEVDALDQSAVNQYVETVAAKAASIDISFNAINIQDKQNIFLTDISLEDFLRPISISMKTHFITGTAAGRQMARQGSGVILSLTATPGGIGYAKVAGFGPACCALEALSTNLAAELGPSGVRVVNIRSGGSPDSTPFAAAMAADPEGFTEFMEKMAADTMLKSMPMMQDIANVAVFLASGMAAEITGVTIDVTCGTTAALNYKVTEIPFV